MKFEILRSTKNKDFYWRLRARNGRIIADSAEGYNRQSEAKKAVFRLINGISKATIKDPVI